LFGVPGREPKGANVVELKKEFDIATHILALGGNGSRRLERVRSVAL
jgi:hypothetical protein